MSFQVLHANNFRKTSLATALRASSAPRGTPVAPAPAAAGLWAVHGRRLTHSASKRQQQKNSRKHCSARLKSIPAKLRQTSDRKTPETVGGSFFSWSRDPVRCQKRTGERPRRPWELAGFGPDPPRKTLIPCPRRVVTPCPNVRIVRRRRLRECFEVFLIIFTGAMI